MHVAVQTLSRASEGSTSNQGSVNNSSERERRKATLLGAMTVTLVPVAVLMVVAMYFLLRRKKRRNGQNGQNLQFAQNKHQPAVRPSFPLRTSTGCPISPDEKHANAYAMQDRSIQDYNSGIKFSLLNIKLCSFQVL